MNRIRLTLTAASLALAAVAAPAMAQSPVKAPTKAFRTTATAAATRAAGKVAAHVAETEAAGQAAPKTKPAPPAPAAKPAPSTAKPAAAAAAKPASTPAAAAVDSARGAKGTSVSKRGATSEMVFQREVYSYPGAGRRDPFASLLKSGDLRPLISDLRLVAVIYDATGRNSVAILRDLTTKDQYRVKTGQTLGRMRVAQIQPKHVVFTIDEFGYNRQETLSLTDTNTARNQ